MPYEGTSRIADLLLRRGQSEAQGIRGSGAAWAQGFEDLGRIGAQTIKDVMAVPEMEAKRKAEQQRQRMAEIQLEREERKVKGDALERELIPSFTDKQTGITDHERVQRGMRDMGFSDYADAYGEKIRRQQNDVLNDFNTRIKGRTTEYGKAQEILNELNAMPPAQRPAAWKRVQGPLADIAGGLDPSLVPFVSSPEYPGDNALNQFVAFTQASLASDEVAKRGIDKRLKADQAAGQSVRSWQQEDTGLAEMFLAGAAQGGAAGWARTAEEAKRRGVSQSVIDSFGTYSLQNVDAAMRRAQPQGAQGKDDDSIFNSFLRNQIKKEEEIAAAEGERRPLDIGERTALWDATRKEHELRLQQRRTTGASADDFDTYITRLTNDKRRATGDPTAELGSEEYLEARKKWTTVTGRTTTGTGTSQAERNAEWRERRNLYNDALNQWKLENAEAIRTKDPNLKAFPDMQTWEWQEFGIGEPSMKSQVVRDMVRELILDQAKKNADIDVTDEAAINRAIDAFLAIPANVERIRQRGMRRVER